MRIEAYEGYGWILWPAANMEFERETCSLIVGWLKWFVEFTWTRRRRK